MNAIKNFARDYGQEESGNAYGQNLESEFRSCVQSVIGNKGDVFDAWNDGGSEGYAEWHCSIKNVEGMAPNTEFMLTLVTDLEDGNSWLTCQYNTADCDVLGEANGHVGDFDPFPLIDKCLKQAGKSESKKHTCSMQKKIESFKKNESAGTSFYDEFIAERAREILEAYDMNDAQGSGDAWSVLNDGDVLDIDREDYSGFISYNDGGVRKQWIASMFSIEGQGVGDEKARKYYDYLWHSCVADYENYCKKKGVACDTDSEDFYDYEAEWFSDEYCDIFADAEIWLYSGDRGSFGDRGTYTLHCRINRSFNHNGINPEDDLDVFMKLDASRLTQENADKFFAAVEDALATYTFSKGYKEIEVKAD